MKVTLLITTYNWPEALSAVLFSVLNQTRLPDEIVIADDGSTQQTAQVINAFKELFSIPVHHCWQEDKGFRVARSRNNGIACASGDYIVIIDGDILLHPEFIADHCKVAKQGTFVTGKRVKLSQGYSQRYLTPYQDALKSQALISPSKPAQTESLNFFSNGIEKGKAQTIRSKVLQAMFKLSDTASIKGLHSCNMAFWRKDAIAVNGFNADFEGWGPEDQEFAQRLINSGLQRHIVKHYALAYHLFHKESERTQLAENTRLLKQIQQQKVVRCINGIDKI